MSSKKLSKKLLKISRMLFEGNNLDTQLETMFNNTSQLLNEAGTITNQEKSKEYQSIMNRYRLKLIQLNAQLKYEVQEFINKYGRTY
jgi:hypothetical protein